VAGTRVGCSPNSTERSTRNEMHATLWSSATLGGGRCVA
jgi:hypothetical protein